MNDDEPPNPKPPRAVLKFGGEVVADTAALVRVLDEVRALIADGWSFVLVHGGGPQSNDHAAALGLEVQKVAGRRVTDGATLEVAKQILAGAVNVDVVATARARGVRAVGLAGVSLLTATRRAAEVVEGEPVDWGFVGEVAGVDTALVELLWADGRTPVLAPLAADSNGQAYNINADTVASAIAAAVHADHLFLMTAAGGVLGDITDPDTRIPTLTPTEARDAIATGVIAGGMIPKVADALDQLERGIGVVHILGACSLRAAANDPGCVGTAIASKELR
ncbi:MAG: acetylglutamate kinase [Nannocystales bacterium]